LFVSETGTNVNEIVTTVLRFLAVIPGPSAARSPESIIADLLARNDEINPARNAKQSGAGIGFPACVAPMQRRSVRLKGEPDDAA
jgi:hypothetical protein